jgi:single-strand DNA-binding protein
MAANNVCTFLGNLTRDPELKHIPNGDAVCDFGIAVNGYKEGQVLFLNCTSWRKTAEIMAERLVKGEKVLVTGELQQEEWEKDGVTQRAFKLNVSGFSFTGSKANMDKANPPVGTGSDIPF